MKPFILALFAALAAGLVLTGCGQKGPLYLPGHNPNPPRPLIKSSNGPDHAKPSEGTNGRASGPSSGGVDASHSDNATP